MLEYPIVSIVISTFNKAEYLSDTICSVINQTYNNWQLIIVDDFSTDDSVCLINSFLIKEPRIKLYVNTRNEGANYSRNFGIEHSDGEYIIFLDADDLLVDSCLFERVALMNRNPSCDFIVFTMGVFNKKIGDNLSLWLPNKKKALTDFLQHTLPWGIVQPIWRRRFLYELGGFDLRFKRMQDVELHTRSLLKENVNFEVVIASPDCFYRIDEGRKNYAPVELLNRWVDSAALYIDTFYYPSVKLNCSNYLYGTFLKIYMQIIYNYRKNKISKDDFLFLESKLQGSLKPMSLNKFRKLIIKFSKIYNLYIIRIPGINWMLNKFICIDI